MFVVNKIRKDIFMEIYRTSGMKPKDYQFVKWLRADEYASEAVYYIKFW